MCRACLRQTEGVDGTVRPDRRHSPASMRIGLVTFLQHTPILLMRPCLRTVMFVSNDTPIRALFAICSFLLTDTNQMEEKGRFGCPWSITITNGGGIAGGESGIRKSSHSLYNHQASPKNGGKLRNPQNPSRGCVVGFWRRCLENARPKRSGGKKEFFQ